MSHVSQQSSPYGLTTCWLADLLLHVDTVTFSIRDNSLLSKDSVTGDWRLESTCSTAPLSNFPRLADLRCQKVIPGQGFVVRLHKSK